MIRRPINPQFNAAILDGTKTTTIRQSQWPLNVPIRLYNWAGAPYRSKQIPTYIVEVWSVSKTFIHHNKTGVMHYVYEHIAPP